MPIPVRTLAEVRRRGDLKWLQPALDRLEASPSQLSHDAPVFIARAPGRLDTMGGFADYSGARVLELPLDRATTVILQAQEDPRCDIVTLREPGRDSFTLDLTPVVSPDGVLGTQAALAEWFSEHSAVAWAGYVLGVVQLMLQRAARAGRAAPAGVRMLIESSVPAGRGVASSAALEVSAGAALAAACGDPIDAPELAAACQQVENRVLGAPCGIMDQMTSACGRQGRLLQLLCRPGTIEGYLRIPERFRFYGIDSGISHAVSGADYATVRTGAFMGYRMLARRAGPDGAPWDGFLAKVTPEEFATLGGDLPEEMSGHEFLKRYERIVDTATAVDAGRRYPVRAATAHPVHEQARIDRFIALLSGVDDHPETAEALGHLMYQSHASYSACGLGSSGTDRLVELVRAAGPRRGLYGAKITGGGSGGTVAVLGSSNVEPALREIAERYRTETGGGGELFTGSGPGAAELGVLQL